MTTPSTPQLLIIGGSGFLSGTLTREAQAQGYQVWTITRGNRPLPAGVTALVADRHDQAAFQQIVPAANTHWDMVIDCIGFQPADAEQDLAVFGSLTDHLIFVSTDFVFDPAHRQLPQPEESDYYLSEGYGGNKRACEHILLDSDPDGLPWTVVRPCHIYGPGSQLGCLPLHGRDPQLIDRIRAGETLQLVGGGHFLQQPILAEDLAKLLLSLGGNTQSYRQIYNATGPDTIESRDYYRIIADVLGQPLAIAELSVQDHLAENPQQASFMCHRIYDMSKLQAIGAAVPDTPIEEGLRTHVESLLA